MEKKIFTRTETLKVAVAILIALIGLTVGIAALTGPETTILPGVVEQNVAVTPAD
jgi:multisubunit Na+/H+ antiporter MnhB subunit